MKRVLVFLAASLLLAVLATIGGVGWIASDRAILPEIRTAEGDEYDPAFHDFPLTEITLTTADGVELEAWYVPGTRPEAVAVLHGFRYARDITLPNIAVLHSAGYHVVAPTFRGSNPRQRHLTTLGLTERADVDAAVAYLRELPGVDPDRIAVLGLSMGASTAIMAAPDNPDIAAVVAEAPYRDIPSLIGGTFEEIIGLPAFPFGPVTIWLSERRSGLDAGLISPWHDAARLNGRPLLVIHGLEDNIIHYSNGVDIYRNAGQPKQLWLVDGAEHAEAVKVAPDEYRDRVLGFLEHSLSAAPAGPPAAAR